MHTKYCLLIMSLLTLTLAFPANRDEIFGGAIAHWQLGDEAIGLRQNGSIETEVPAEGPGARPGARVARLAEAWFDAGKELNAPGNAVTVYLRARDPRGIWSYGLFSKRGTHAIINFNLFSIDLGGSPGSEIGFEIHTERGFVGVNFPVESVGATDWHDFIGRYDGESIALFCDGRLMAQQRWSGGALTQNEEPVLIGAETDNGKVVRPFTGEMEEAALWARALTDVEIAKIMRVDEILPAPGFMPPYESPVHFRPDFGRLADTIPFFWKGEYHIFYLRAIDKVPWEHLVSTDLVHWTELPTALVSDGASDSADGLHMFTGSVTEHGGAFHIFYTGWNPANPAGREWVMHATSPDLITWTKHREHGFRADEAHYQNTDFRDPYVFWYEPEQRFWMILCARDAKTGKPVQGVAKSADLLTWEQAEPLILEPPLGEGTPECPDVFQIGGTWYLIHSPSAGTTDMRYAQDLRGPYRPPHSPNIDTPILYAAKRMFDGKRHIITGWLRDLNGERDGGDFQWGGTQCVPREVYAGVDGQLCFRPVPEATAVFSHRVLALEDLPPLDAAATGWAHANGTLSTTGPAHTRLDAPDNYMLQCTVELTPNTVFSLNFREQDTAGSGYRLILRPGEHQVDIRGATFSYPRPVAMDTAKRVSIQAFVLGPIIECFVNDAYAFSCRAYDLRRGGLGLQVEQGGAEMRRLEILDYQSVKK